MAQLRIKSRIVPTDFVDFFRRIHLDDIKSRIGRFGIIYGGLVDHVRNIISNEVVFCVIIINQINCRLAKYDVKVVEVIMANFDVLL